MTEVFQTTLNLTPIVFEVTLAEVGLVGPRGEGVPAGGTTAQILAKASDDDYDTEWVDNAGGGGGGGSTVTIDADGTLVVDATTVELATDAQMTAEAATRAAADTALAAADTALDGRVDTLEAEQGGSRPPSGAAGGVLSGTYPNPGFAADMATQAELDTEAGTRAAADTALDGRLDAVEANDWVTTARIGNGQVTAAKVAADVATQAELDAVASAKENTGVAAAAVAAHEADTTNVHGIADTADLIVEGDTRLTDARTPSGAAGGVLSGTYPNPGFAADMATQAELDAHAADSTSVHGITDTSALALTADVVAKALFDANTILKADSDNTPAALTVSVDTLVGRLTGGSITSLSVSDVRTLLGLTDEAIQDLVGAMVSGGTETGITVTYDDTNGRFDFVVSGGSGLPTGGATGTVLMKNSATDGDASFLPNNAGGGDYFRSGYYSFGVYGGAISGAALALNRVIYRPFIVPVRRAFDRLGVNVTAAGTAGAVIRLGLYAPGTGGPGALLESSSGLDSTTTGAKELTISRTCDPGIYWVAVVAQVAVCSVGAFGGTVLSPFVAFDTLPSSSVSGSAHFQSSVTGALPDPPVINGSPQTPYPAVALRAA